MSGKGAAARIADRLLFVLLLFVAFCLLFRAHPLQLFLALLATSATGVGFLCAVRVRFARFVRRETERIRHMLLSYSLLTMEPSRLKQMLEHAVAASAFVVCQSEPITLDQFLRQWRENMDARCCFLTAELTPEADELVRQRLPHLKLYAADSTYRLLSGDLPVNETQVNAYIAAVMTERREKRKHPPRLPNGMTAAGKYLAVGALLLALSFLMQYALYYRLLASAAFLAAGMSSVPALLLNLRQKEAPP